MADVSVIIPAFNVAATLSATVASVVRQTFSNWEAIIIDDGSTDSTGATAQAWCDRDTRIKLIRGPNRGVAGARNEAARCASSPWLLFLDADDVIAPGHLDTMLKAATTHEAQADVIYCAGARIAEDGRIGRPEIPPHHDHFKLLSWYCPFYIHACFVRRKIFEKFAGFDPTLKTCEDWDLWQRFARAGIIFAGIDEPLALYRLRLGSLTHNAERLFENGAQVITRGHGRDPRVANPLPGFADGQSYQDYPQAIIGFALWCAGMLIGSGSDPGPFLRRIGLPTIADIAIDRPVSTMYDGVPRGGCLLCEDWPAIWPIRKNSIYEAFSVVEQRCPIPEFAKRCMSEFEVRIRQAESDLSPSLRHCGLSAKNAGQDTKTLMRAGSARNVGNASIGHLPIVLMYHRINKLNYDPWSLSVTPQHFSEQLAALNHVRDVVPLSWLVGKLKRGQLPNRVAALTFDDGYADVLINAKPIMQKVGCPGTFFLATGAINDRKGYWWDILARIIFEASAFPEELTLNIRGVMHSWRLESYRKDREPDAPVNTIDASKLYFELWTLLKPLRRDERQSILSSIAAWVGTHADPQERDQTLVPEEVARLSEPDFCDIGAHTVTHPCLPDLEAAEQRQEIEESRTVCKELAGSLIPGFAYPFGELNDASLSAVSASGFQFACTTVQTPIPPNHDLIRLPRLNVGNWDAVEFDKKILQQQ